MPTSPKSRVRVALVLVLVLGAIALVVACLMADRCALRAPDDEAAPPTPVEEHATDAESGDARARRHAAHSSDTSPPEETHTEETPADESHDEAAAETPAPPALPRTPLPPGMVEGLREIAVLVRHEGGGLAAGVPVQLLSPNTSGSGLGITRLRYERRTSDEGRAHFQVKQWMQLRVIRIVARSGDMVAKSDVIELYPRTDHDVELVLTPSASIDVHVTDERGESVAGAEVLFSPTGPITGSETFGTCVTVETDAAGRAVIPEFALATLHVHPYVRVMAPGYLTFWSEFRREGLLADGLAVRLTTAGTVTGRVVDEVGDPIDGATLLLRESMIQARSDDQGRFSLAGVPPGGGTLIAWGQRIGPVVVGDIEPRDLGDLRLHTNVSISGRVVRENGEPARASHVWLSIEGVNTRAERVDPSGRFTFAHVGQSSVTLRTMGPYERGFVPDSGVLEDVPAGSDGIELVVRPRAALAIQFVEPDGETPLWVLGITATATSDSGELITRTVRSMRSRRSRRLQLIVPPAATYTVRVDVDGFLPAHREGVTVRVGEYTELAFALESDGSGD